MSTGEIIASILGEFEDFLRKVGKMEIFDTLVYNYRLKLSISNLTPELFTDLFAQLLDKLLELKNNLLQWHSIQEFTLSPFQASHPISVSSPAALNLNHDHDENDISASSHSNTREAIVSAIVTGISDNPYNEVFDINSHLSGCPCPSTSSLLDVRECSIPNVEIPFLKTNCSSSSAEMGIEPLNLNTMSTTVTTSQNHSVIEAQVRQSQEAEENDTKKSFLCQTCGKKYSTVQSLTAHLNVHTKSKIFKCSFCEKTFTRKDKCTFHEAVHTGIKSFTCEVCGKTFTRKTKLDEHLNRHKKLKKYKCQKCSKTYASNRDLRNHLEKHDCKNSSTCDEHNSPSSDCPLQVLPPMMVHHLEGDENDDVTITQEVSEIFKLNWPDLQFPPEVEPEPFNLDNNGYIMLQ